MTLSRRTFLGFLAAPAIIRVAEIMPIKPVRADILSDAAAEQWIQEAFEREWRRVRAEIFLWERATDGGEAWNKMMADLRTHPLALT